MRFRWAVCLLFLPLAAVGIAGCGGEEREFSYKDAYAAGYVNGEHHPYQPFGYDDCYQLADFLVGEDWITKDEDHWVLLGCNDGAHDVEPLYPNLVEGLRVALRESQG